MNNDANLARLLQAFFTDRLMRQRHASPHTIASYRDTFCLLLQYVHRCTNKSPAALSLTALDAPIIGAFLDYLEKKRGNSPRTRNVRLAAIHSFFHYVALHEPAYSALSQRILAMPSKRYERAPIAFLTRPEVEALLAAPDQKTWFGRRDRTLLQLDLQTGLRVSELIGLRCQDIELGHGAHVYCLGKGRKARCTPLRSDAVTALHQWLDERQGQATDPLFVSQRGGPLSRDSIEYLVGKHAKTALQQCPSLKHKHVTPHVLRHYLPFLTISCNAEKHPQLLVKSKAYAQKQIRLPDIIFSVTDCLENSIADHRVDSGWACLEVVLSWRGPFLSSPALPPNKSALFRPIHVQATMR